MPHLTLYTLYHMSRLNEQMLLVVATALFFLHSLPWCALRPWLPCRLNSRLMRPRRNQVSPTARAHIKLALTSASLWTADLVWVIIKPTRHHELYYADFRPKLSLSDDWRCGWWRWNIAGCTELKKLAFNCWREYIHSATLQYLANSSYGATWSTLNLGELNGDNKCDLFCPFHVHRALL